MNHTKDIATLPVTQTDCINITSIIHDIDDYVMVRWNGEKPQKRKIKYELYEYSNDREPCFTFYGNTYFLNEFMRVNQEGRW